MPNSDLEEKISQIDDRVKKLEQSNKQEEILDILNKIKDRLMGQLNSESPGLISDVKSLKDSEKITQSQLKSIDENIQEIRKNQSLRINFEDEMKVIKKEIEKIKKLSYVLYGSFIVIGWLLSKIEPSSIIKAISGH